MDATETNRRSYGGIDVDSIIGKLCSGLLVVIIDTLGCTGAEAGAAAGAAPVRIHAIHLEHRLNEAGTGDYNKLLAALSRRGLRFTTSIAPLKRWLARVKGSPDSCFFPVSVAVLQTYDADFRAARFVTSKVIDRVELRVFTLADRPAITDLKQLSGKRIATWKGGDASHFTRGIDALVDTSRSESSQVQMLHAERLDAIIGFAPDIGMAAKSLGLVAPRYHRELSLLGGQGALLACYDTPGNRRFVAAFDEGLEQLRQAGELGDIFGEFVELAVGE